MNHSLKLIGLVFILLSKFALSYYEYDQSQVNEEFLHFDSHHSAHLHIFDGPFVFEDQSKSENEDDTDDLIHFEVEPVYSLLAGTSYSFISNTGYLTNKEKDPLFILFRNFRL